MSQSQLIFVNKTQLTQFTHRSPVKNVELCSKGNFLISPINFFVYLQAGLLSVWSTREWHSRHLHTRPLRLRCLTPGTWRISLYPGVLKTSKWFPWSWTRIKGHWGSYMTPPIPPIKSPLGRTMGATWIKAPIQTECVAIPSENVRSLIFQIWVFKVV